MIICTKDILLLASAVQYLKIDFTITINLDFENLIILCVKNRQIRNYILQIIL